uniref:Peroxidase n=1 Tax=Fagus sylvatica TaxID=28930 RepID=A0A2N9EGU4_FAGSY
MSRGFGFVTFSNEKSMRDAIEGMNGHSLDGCNITVNEAQSRGNGGGDGGGGGYSRGSLRSVQAPLQLGFYSKNCPRAEKINQDFVNTHIHNAPSLAAALVRMHFHDSFVRGCDSSVLLNSTSNNQAEKDAPPNLTLISGFDFVDRVKSLVEAECPGMVSCSDIIALTHGGPFWRFPTGRRDGTISISTEALNNIPPPFGNFTLQTLFSNQGLDLNDLVLLISGAALPSFDCYSIPLSSTLFKHQGEGSEKDPQGVEGPPEKDPQVVEGPPERPSCFIQCCYGIVLKIDELQLVAIGGTNIQGAVEVVVP